MANKFVMALGLNPAYQKTLFLDKLRKGHVNRAYRATCIASGKGINYCRASRAWGQNSLLLQFLGGETGKYIESALIEEGMNEKTVRVAPATRTCTTCLCEDSGSMTELIEPSGEISPKKLESLLQLVQSELPSSCGVALCGTVPPGVGTTAYKTAVAGAKKYNIPVLLDSWKDVDEILEVGVTILKINKDELLTLSRKDNLKDALRFCKNKYPLKIIAITNGPGNAFLYEAKKLWKLSIPKLDKIINPIGAGDTTSAVMFAEYLSGTTPVEAFASGLAAASASCLTENAAEFDIDLAKKLKTKVKISSENF